MRNSRDHLGVGFNIWTGQLTWFWSLVDPGRDGGVVGAALSEADAIREACAAIEERSARTAATAAACRGRRGSAMARFGTPWMINCERPG